MGICIYYKGKLKSEDSLPKLIEEVKDIAVIHKWTYHIFKREFPENHFEKVVVDKEMYGILFTPPDSEPVQLTFLSNGDMRSPWDAIPEVIDEEDKEAYKFLSTKTHYAGPAIHKLVVELFDYLNGKYLKDFQLIDEAEYWEAKDEKVLYKNFDNLNALINAFGERLESNTILEDETFETYIRRIAKDIHSKNQSDS